VPAARTRDAILSSPVVEPAVPEPPEPATTRSEALARDVLAGKIDGLAAAATAPASTAASGTGIPHLSSGMGDPANPIVVTLKECEPHTTLDFALLIFMANSNRFYGFQVRPIFCRSCGSRGWCVLRLSLDDTVQIVLALVFLVVFGVLLDRSGLMKAGPQASQFEATKETKPVKFSDVHGCDEAKDVSLPLSGGIVALPQHHSLGTSRSRSIPQRPDQVFDSWR
jgi:ATP-dependent metalloprotease